MNMRMFQQLSLLTLTVSGSGIKPTFNENDQHHLNVQEVIAEYLPQKARASWEQTNKNNQGIVKQARNDEVGPGDPNLRRMEGVDQITRKFSELIQESDLSAQQIFKSFRWNPVPTVWYTLEARNGIIDDDIQLVQNGLHRIMEGLYKSHGVLNGGDVIAGERRYSYLSVKVYGDHIDFDGKFRWLPRDKVVTFFFREGKVVHAYVFGRGEASYGMVSLGTGVHADISFLIQGEIAIFTFERRGYLMVRVDTLWNMKTLDRTVMIAALRLNYFIQSDTFNLIFNLMKMTFLCLLTWCICYLLLRTPVQD